MAEGKFVGLVILAFGLFIALMFVILNAQAEACADRGGHMVTIYKSQICVSEDGRIIE